MSMTPAQRSKLSKSLKGKSTNRSGYPVNSSNAPGEYKPNKLYGRVSNPVTINRSLPLFGERTRRSIPYFEVVSITGVAAQLYSYVYAANGCFDPNVTGTGHQPMGFDQMMTFYNHYTVISSKIKVTFSNQSNLDSYAGLEVSGSSAYSVDYTVHMENGEIVYAPLQPINVFGNNATLSTSVNCAKFQGMSPSIIMADSQMRGDAASNPAEVIYYLLPVWNPVTVTAPVVVANVLIVYDVIFHEPRKGTIS
jgi:hypothetical protein